MLDRLERLHKLMDSTRTRVNGPHTTFVEDRVEAALARLDKAGVLTEYGQEPNVELMCEYHENSPLRYFMVLGWHIPSGLTDYIFPLLWAQARRQRVLRDANAKSFGTRSPGKSSVLRRPGL